MKLFKPVVFICLFLLLTVAAVFGFDGFDESESDYETY